MKKIIICVPTSYSEIKKYLINSLNFCLNFVKHPFTKYLKRVKENKEIFKKLQSDIYYVLNSGYWNNDISETMKNALTKSYPGSPNGILHKIIWDAFIKLK